MAEHKDQYIRSQVANNPNASDDILLLLSEEWEPQIEDRLQKRKPLSPRLLAGLAHSPSASMRLFVAKHAEASAESLTALASDPWIDIRMAVATNANTPLDKLVELASDKTAEVRTTVASIPLLSQEIFPRLANDKSEYVRASVAANPATPTMVLDKLSRDRSWRVRYRLAKNPSLAANIITRFSRYNFLRLAVAENRCASPKDLRRLSVSKDYKVRAAVASNPNTPIDILEMLSHDDHYDGQVQLAVCKSKYGDEIFTGRLLHDAAWRVVDYFASNGRTAPHLLLELVASDHHTRRRLATNWSVPPSGLAKLAEDEDQEVRSFVASNGNTPPQALDVLLTRCLSEKDRPSPWPGVSTSHRMQRWGVARHENSLPETLARLVHDPDESVREQVAENLNSILEDL